MDRRTALKYFAVGSAAAMLLPGCLQDKKKVSAVLENLNVMPDDEELLAALAETIIPAADGKPGAKEVEAHLFTFVMIHDCQSPADNEKFMKGLRAFNKAVPGEDSFLELSAADKLQALKTFEKESGAADETVKHFYNTAKGYIIYGYTSSQYYLTEVSPYKLVPGPVFKGCVPLSEKV